MYYIAIVAWLAGIGLSFYNGNRKLPITVLLLGIAVMVAAHMIGRPPFGIAGIALLGAVIWIGNKADMM